MNVLQHQEAGDTIIVVTRYFGGIKLGAGGLVRAYSQAAQSVIETAKFFWFETQLSVQVNFDFSLESLVRNWVTGNQSSIVNVIYTTDVAMELKIPNSKVAEFVVFLQNNRIDNYSVDNLD